MKNIIFTITFYLLAPHVWAQHNNIENIKKYYYRIDKYKIVDTLRTYYLDLYRESYEIFNLSIDSAFQSQKYYWEQMRSGKSIVMLVPMLKNAKDYTFKKDIYEFINIDTTDICIVHFDEKEKAWSVLGPEIFSFGEKCSKKEFTELKGLLRFIEKERPEILLTSGYVFKDMNWKSRNSNILFIKDDKIFIYRSKYKKFYELNRFLHRYFNKRFFYKKRFKERAIYDERARKEHIVLVGS